jgi:hypothetical protein
VINHTAPGVGAAEAACISKQLCPAKDGTYWGSSHHPNCTRLIAAMACSGHDTSLAHKAFEKIGFLRVGLSARPGPCPPLKHNGLGRHKGEHASAARTFGTVENVPFPVPLRITLRENLIGPDEWARSETRSGLSEIWPCVTAKVPGGTARKGGIPSGSYGTTTMADAPSRLRCAGLV